MNYKTNLRNIIFSLFICHAPVYTYATNLEQSYIERLKGIEKFKGNGSNLQLTLIRKSAEELATDWSPVLANELARVFNELLNVNQNYFLVELIEPVMKKRKKEFMPIFNKALSDKNKILYKKSLQMLEREDKEGNG